MRSLHKNCQFYRVMTREREREREKESRARLNTSTQNGRLFFDRVLSNLDCSRKTKNNDSRWFHILFVVVLNFTRSVSHSRSKVSHRVMHIYPLGDLCSFVNSSRVKSSRGETRRELFLLLFSAPVKAFWVSYVT